MANIKGIDISKYQPSVDYAKVKEAGYNFIIARASLGSYTKDAYFEKHYNGAKSAGIGIGAYHYFYSKTVEQAKAEAAFFVDQLDGKQFDYPVAIDVEEPSIVDAGKNAISEAVKEFCEYVESNGYYVMVYANPTWLNNYLTDEIKKRYDLWLAHWIDKPSRDCGIWQYTNAGYVNGISGKVDCNIAYKDYQAIIKNGGFNGYKKEQAQTKPAEEFAVGDVVTVTGAYASSASGKAVYTAAKGSKRYIVKIISGAENPYQLGAKPGNTASANTTGFAPAGSISKEGTANTGTFKAGEKVKVNSGAKDYNGGGLADFVYKTVFTVLEDQKGSRVVIGLNGKVTAAMNANDLKRA